jgi:hypothetical protein
MDKTFNEKMGTAETAFRLLIAAGVIALAFVVQAVIAALI